MGLPGVKVGPLDPEATAGFGNVNARNNARRLIRLHAASMPIELSQALSKPVNEPRTKALLLDEVAGAVEVPEGHVVVGATVRGKEDDPSGLVLTYTYRHEAPEKSRSVKWFVPLDDVAGDLPDSMETGDTAARVAHARELGVLGPLGGSSHGIVTGDAEPQRLARENASLRKRVDELSQELRTRDARRVNDEAQDAPGGEPAPEDDEGAPWEGYDELSADDVKAELSDADRDVKDSVLAYERAHKNRKTVVAAAEE